MIDHNPNPDQNVKMQDAKKRPEEAFWADRDAGKPLRLNGVGFVRLAGRIGLPIMPFFLISIACAAFGTGTGNLRMMQFGMYLSMMVGCGVILPAIVHELSHAVMLRLLAGIRTVTTNLTWRYFSLNVPTEQVHPQASLVVALAGPLVTALCGVIWHVGGFTLIAILHYAHLLALLPLFGDGRQVLDALARLRRDESSGE